MRNYPFIRRLVVATGLMIAMISGSAVFADDDDTVQVLPFGFGAYGNGIRNMPMMALQIDTNDDGIVSAAEASQHASTGFTRFDSDNDDQITEDEYLDSAPVGMPMGRRATERLYVNRTERFKDIDADGDGNVTLAEFMAKAQASYEAADLNDDATVTVWEFRSQQNPF